MIRALYTAASGMSAQQLNLDTIANNLANSSTTGFRQLRLEFQDMVYQNLVTPGAAQSQSTVSAGLADRAGHQIGGHRGDHDPGLAEPDLESAGCGHRGHRLLSGAAARRHHRLHPRRAVSAEQPGNHRDHRRRSGDSHHHHSVQCHGGHHHPVRGGERDPAGPAESLATGAVATGHLSQPRGLGEHGIEPACRPRSAPATRCWATPAEPRGWARCSRGTWRTRMWTWSPMFVQMVLAQRAYESNSKVIKAADDMYSQVNNMTQVEIEAVHEA